jgi:hypothetical protein
MPGPCAARRIVSTSRLRPTVGKILLIHLAFRGLSFPSEMCTSAPEPAQNAVLRKEPSFQVYASITS